MKDSFFQGNGLAFIPKKVDNLFRLNPKYEQESLDYIHLKKFLLKKKFAPILLKEAFFVLKLKGYLIIDYQPSNDINFQSIEKLLWWLFKGNYNIILHTRNEKNRLVIQKKKRLFALGDSIDKWSFGIVTNGDRDKWIELMISSIKKQNIPQYEIIVCGKYKKRPEKNFVYINFNERSDKGWVNKKKNLIAEIAKYENLCIMHDRLVLKDNWFEGMKKYGNAFEVLGCIQKKKNGVRTGDWLTWGGPPDRYYSIAGLDYRDWEEWVYLSLSVIIMKKSMYQKVLLDETGYWWDYYDSEFASRLKNAGYIIRFNSFSKCLALAWNHGNIPVKYDPSKRLIPDMIIRRSMRLAGRLLYKIPIINKLIYWGYSQMAKLPITKRLFPNYPYTIF